MHIMQAVPGIMEFSPAVRSCMIEYDQRVISLSSLLRLLEGIEADLPLVNDTAIFAWHMVDCHVSSLTSQLWLRVNQCRSTCQFKGCSCTIDSLILW